jgi:hypothetical protein
VWAGKTTGVNNETLRESLALGTLLGTAAERALLRGHENIQWLRVYRGEEAAGRCARCGGRVYVGRFVSLAALIDGDIFNIDCESRP